METGYTLFRFEFMLLLLSFRHLKQKRISVYEFLKFYPARVQSLAGRFSVHFHMQRRTYTNNWLSVGDISVTARLFVYKVYMDVAGVVRQGSNISSLVMDSDRAWRELTDREEADGY